MIDLRVDDHRAPLTELRRLLNMFRSRELVAIANARLMEKNISAAAEAALVAREKSPENDEAWVVFAATELGAGRKSGALDALRRASTSTLRTSGNCLGIVISNRYSAIPISRR